MTGTLILVRHGQSEWNLLNLFTGWRNPDLTELGMEEARATGRALKAASITAVPLVGTAGGGVAASVLGAASSAIEADLAESDMLGDCGANALGAALGTALVLGAPRPVRLAALGAVVALTLVSERVSFTRVIERTPVLREIDGSGRRPAARTEPAT